jgi:hypothetical protein
MRPEEIDYTQRKARYYIDTSNGEVLAGQKQLTEYRSANSEANIHKLGEALRYPTGLVAELELPKLVTNEWSEERYIDFGKWIIATADPVEARKRHTTINLFRNARHLGLGPSRKEIDKVFDNHSIFFGKVHARDAKIHNQFTNWEIEDFVKYIQKVGGDTKPSYKLIQELSEKDSTRPSYEYIRNRFSSIGGFLKIVELAGYPTVRTWENEDYVEWGVKFMLANEGLIPTARMLDYFSSKKLGPGASSVIGRFDKYASYQRQVIKAFEEERDDLYDQLQGHVSSIKGEINQRTIPLELFAVSTNDDQSDDPPYVPESFAEILDFMNETDMVLRYAMYKVMSAVAPTIGEDTKIKLIMNTDSRHFIKEIRKHHTHIKPGEIEHAALVQGFFDVIWPMDNLQKKLTIGDDYEHYHLEKTGRSFGMPHLRARVPSRPPQRVLAA